LSVVDRWTVAPARERVSLYFAQRAASPAKAAGGSQERRWIGRVLTSLALIAIAYGAVKIVLMMTKVSRPEFAQILLGAGATFLRVVVTLLLAAAWTIPVGVYIGLRPRVSAVLQPVAQIAASVPATALFPVLLLILIRLGGGLGIGSIALLLLGTQWYLLFNVIAGASAIPSDLKEVSEVFRFGRGERWRKLILPAIFPYLVTGFVTASGGAWNASIIAEYFHFKGQTMSTVGLGAVISRADNGNFSLLIAATVVMATMVVTINRLLWRRMYALAATRFKLE
jgi:NitT/TauT family transport system permease protein